MKLIEAMKEVKLLEKRIERNLTQIQQYATYNTITGPAFESADIQREEVAKLIQANGDLVTRAITLKGAIDRTNLDTIVEHHGKKLSIHELILLRIKWGHYMVGTYKSLNTTVGMNQFNLVSRQGVDATNPPKLITLYDEQKKNEALKYWQELIEDIDATLEVVNAVTDLKE